MAATSTAATGRNRRRAVSKVSGSMGSPPSLTGIRRILAANCDHADMIEAYLGNMRAGHFGFQMTDARFVSVIGNRHQLRARCFYADAGVAVRVADSIAAAAKAAQIASHLLVQPDVLEARAAVDAVDHLGHPLHPWLVADRRARVEEDRPESTCKVSLARRSGKALNLGRVRTRLAAGARRIRTCMGFFLSSSHFGLMPVLCSEREGRSSSRRLRSGSRSARKGSRDRNASRAWSLRAGYSAKTARFIG